MQLSSGKPLPSSVLSSIFRWKGKGGKRRGGGSGDPSASDGGAIVGSSLLSSSPDHCAISPGSVAILPSCNGWPGTQPMTAQSLHLGQPTCSLGLCSTKPPPAVTPVANSQSWPLSKCHAGQTLALSQAGVLPVSRSPPDPSLLISPVSTLFPSAFPSLCLSDCHRLPKPVGSVKVT